MNVVHIGLPKTGSTTLQNTLFAEQQHFAYLGKSENLYRDQPSPANSDCAYPAQCLPLGLEGKLLFGSAVLPSDRRDCEVQA